MSNRAPLRVFVDSDVIISSLISNTGAAHILLSTAADLNLFISNISNQELEQVVDRLNLSQLSLQALIKSKLHVIEVKQSTKELKAIFSHYYVRDENDAHIVAGAIEAKATFLTSYNIRHFDVEKIQQNFHITVITPGLFLQYLRSL